jgi:hypothetical protein
MSIDIFPNVLHILSPDSVGVLFESIYVEKDNFYIERESTGDYLIKCRKGKREMFTWSYRGYETPYFLNLEDRVYLKKELVFVEYKEAPLWTKTTKEEAQKLSQEAYEKDFGTK